MINKKINIQNGDGKGKCKGCCFLWCCSAWTWNKNNEPLDKNRNIIIKCKFY